MTLLLAGVAAVVLSIATPANAITYGAPDGNTHPEVGALISDHAFSDGTWTYCSGTLISPTVFLTAAHCGDPGQTTARVSFADRYTGGAVVYTGRWLANPLYSHVESDPHDQAVVLFDQAVKGITPAVLPTAGLLDRLKADGTLKTATFTSVGYGSFQPTNAPGGKTWTYADTRYAASGSLDSLTGAWLKLSQNPATGDGGTCYGDSGGPNFLGGATSRLLVGTTITGDAVCRSTNVDYRTDTADARAFLGQFVALP